VLVGGGGNRILTRRNVDCMLLRGQPGRLPDYLYGEQENLTVLYAAVSQKVGTMFIRSLDWRVTVAKYCFPYSVHPVRSPIVWVLA